MRYLLRKRDLACRSFRIIKLNFVRINFENSGAINIFYMDISFLFDLFFNFNNNKWVKSIMIPIITKNLANISCEMNVLFREKEF